MLSDITGHFHFSHPVTFKNLPAYESRRPEKGRWALPVKTKSRRPFRTPARYGEVGSSNPADYGKTAIVICCFTHKISEAKARKHMIPYASSLRYRKRQVNLNDRNTFEIHTADASAKPNRISVKRVRLGKEPTTKRVIGDLYKKSPRTI